MDILKIREALGLSRAELAKKLHVTRQAIYQWEAKEGKPSSLARFAINELLSRESKRAMDPSQRLQKDITEMWNKPIKEAMEILGVSVDGLAKILDVESSTVMSWVASGKKVPDYYRRFIKFLVDNKISKI